MGLLGDIFGLFGSGSSSKRSQRPVSISKRDDHSSQVRAERMWHGVPLRELAKLVDDIYHGQNVTVDEYGFLVVHFTSRSGKKTHHVQCSVDENGKLRRDTNYPYPGQYRDSADTFIEKANQIFTFTQ